MSVAPSSTTVARLVSPDFDLTTMLRIVREHLLSVIVLACVVSALVALIVFRIPSTYTATATLLVEPDKEDQIGLDAVFASGQQSREYFETQRSLITSRSLLRKVAASANLPGQPEFQRPRTQGWWQGNLLRHLPGLPDDPYVFEEDADSDLQYAAKKLADTVTVSAIPRTQLLKVSVGSRKPELAQKITDAVIAEYINSGLEARLAKTKSANAWLGGRLEKMKSDLAGAEGRLQAFLSSNELVDVGGVRSLVEKDITENTAGLLKARKTVAELSAVIKKIRSAGSDWQQLAKIQAVAANTLVQQTRAEYLDAREKLAAISQRYGPKHPKRIDAEALNKEAQASYVTQVKAATQNIQSNYELARQRVSDIGRFTEENKTELQELDRKSYQLRVLERDVATNRQLYDLFLNKLKETDLSDDFQTVNAIVVDEAALPTTPSAPKRVLIIAASFVSVVLIVYGLLFLRWLLDKAVREPDQLAQKVPGAVLLGSVPNEPQLGEKPGSGQVANAFDRVIVHQAAYLEAIQRVRTGLFLTEPDKPNQVTLVTSALPGEGKTTLSSALAVSLSRVGKTLLIDGDMRRPHVAEVLGLSGNKVGLAQCIVGASQLHDSVQQHPEYAQLDILPTGALPPNPLELLGSTRFLELLEECRSKYDRVIVDCPPVEPVSDVLMIASLADAIIYTMRADSTSSMVAANSISSLQEAGGRVIGTVLNALNTKRLTRYYGGRYDGYAAAGYYRAAKG